MRRGIGSRVSHCVLESVGRVVTWSEADAASADVNTK